MNLFSENVCVGEEKRHREEARRKADKRRSPGPGGKDGAAMDADFTVVNVKGDFPSAETLRERLAAL